MLLKVSVTVYSSYGRRMLILNGDTTRKKKLTKKIKLILERYRTDKTAKSKAFLSKHSCKINPVLENKYVQVIYWKLSSSSRSLKLFSSYFFFLLPQRYIARTSLRRDSLCNPIRFILTHKITGGFPLQITSAVTNMATKLLPGLFLLPFLFSFIRRIMRVPTWSSSKYLFGSCPWKLLATAVRCVCYVEKIPWIRQVPSQLENNFRTH